MSFAWKTAGIIALSGVLWAQGLYLVQVTKKDRVVAEYIFPEEMTESGIRFSMDMLRQRYSVRWLWPAEMRDKEKIPSFSPTEKLFVFTCYDSSLAPRAQLRVREKERQIGVDLLASAWAKEGICQRSDITWNVTPKKIAPLPSAGISVPLKSPLSSWVNGETYEEIHAEINEELFRSFLREIEVLQMNSGDSLSGLSDTSFIEMLREELTLQVRPSSTGSEAMIYLTGKKEFEYRIFWMGDKPEEIVPWQRVSGDKVKVQFPKPGTYVIQARAGDKVWTAIARRR